LGELNIQRTRRGSQSFEQQRPCTLRYRADDFFSPAQHRRVLRGGVEVMPSKFYGQAERAISTGKLHALLRFHIQPIKHVVFVCPSFPFWVGRSHLEECFTLICIQRLSQPNFATQPCHWHDSWNTRGSSIPVLSY
jgi:hypothetical protein